MKTQREYTQEEINKIEKVLMDNYTKWGEICFKKLKDPNNENWGAIQTRMRNYNNIIDNFYKNI